MRPREELPGRSPIAPGQARLTSELFADWLLEKKLQLIGMSILLILLSPGPGCYSTRHLCLKVQLVQLEPEPNRKPKCSVLRK